MTPAVARSGSVRIRPGAAALIVAYGVVLYLALAAAIRYTNIVPHLAAPLGLHDAQEYAPPIMAMIETRVTESRAVPSGATFLLGDSIIHGLEGQAFAPGLHNLAVPGQTTRTLAVMLQRLSNLPDTVRIIIGIGINDLLYRDTITAARDYRAMLALLPPGPEVLLIAILPVRETVPRPRVNYPLRNAAIDVMNGEIRSACTRHPRCRVVETHLGMVDNEGQLRADLHAPDGWHLSASGNAHLAALLQAAIAQP